MSSKKNTSATTSQTQSGTTTPNVPDWLLNPAQTLAGQVSDLATQPSSAYTPGVSSLQQQANTAASGLTSSPLFGQAGTAIGNVGDVAADNVTGSSVLDNLSAYYNPFQSQVLNPVLADYDQQAGQTRAAQAAAAAKNSAFQGSRYGIQEAQTEDDLARGRATTEGNLLNQMYTSATGLSEVDAARRQQADLANQSANLTAATANQNAGLQKGSLLANLGTAEGTDARANTALQGQLGSDETNLENAAKQYPLQYQAQLESLLAGLNPALFTGQSTTGQSTGTSDSTTTSDPSVLGALGSALQIGSMFTPAGALSGLFGGLGGAASSAGSGAASALGGIGNFLNPDVAGLY